MRGALGIRGSQTQVLPRAGETTGPQIQAARQVSQDSWAPRTSSVGPGGWQRARRGQRPEGSPESGTAALWPRGLGIGSARPSGLRGPEVACALENGIWGTRKDEPGSDPHGCPGTGPLTPASLWGPLTKAGVGPALCPQPARRSGHAAQGACGGKTVSTALGSLVERGSDPGPCGSA